LIERSKPRIEFIEKRKAMAVECAAKAQSLLDASLAAGLPHYHACAGQVRCSTCRVLVIDDSAAVSIGGVGISHTEPSKKTFDVFEIRHFGHCSITTLSIDLFARIGDARVPWTGTNAYGNAV
jgi:hypothetical protein